MKLEDQVCSLELAKRLKELGVKKESLFYWERQYLPQIITDWRLSFGHQYNEYISAFTVSELGNMLPNCTPFTYVKSLINTYILSSYTKYPPTEGNNEADSRAKMLIYLIENNIIKIEDVNNGK